MRGVRAVDKIDMSSTYAQREVQCEAEAREVDEGEWQALFRDEVFYVIHWSYQDRKSR